MVQEPASAMTLTLPSDLEVLITRRFAAPRELVFEALTKPGHVTRWYGLRNSTLSVCEIDLRPGGSWRYVLCDADGNEYPFKGTYREIVPPELLVRTETFDVKPWDEHVTVVTMTLTEEDGGTLLTSSSLYQTKEARDGHVASGLEHGTAETYERLAELLDTMK
jgi:uncharacterized protein YndB with AHSA1/START domain